MHWVCSTRWSSTTAGTNCKCGCRERGRASRDASMINKPVIGIAAAVVVIAAGTWYYLHSRHASAARQSAAVQQPEPAPASLEPPIQHPLPTADSGSTAPLPALAESDPALSEALALVAGREAVKSYLLPE